MASGNAVLVINDFEDFVEENMPEGSLELWTGFSILFDLSNPISTKKKGEALKDFNDFVVVWNLFKETDRYKNLEKSSDNEELILQVNALIEELIISQ